MAPRKEPLRPAPTGNLPPGPDRPVRPWLRPALALAAGVGSASLAAMGLFLFLGPWWSWGLGLGRAGSLVWDAGLCLGFFAVHSGLLRRPVKTRLAALVPPELQPALYAFVSGLVLLALVLLWQPTGPEMRLEGLARMACRGIFVLALAGFFWTGRSLTDLDALGWRSGYGYLRGRAGEEPPRMAVQGPYRWVRHPFYLFTLGMLWSQPDLSADRFLFNLLFTLWIAAGTYWEERDLVRLFGSDYQRYQKSVPRLFPVRLRPARFEPADPATGENEDG